MAEAYRCPQCGSEVPGDAPLGLCPNCVLKAGLQPDSVLQTGAESASTGCCDAHFVPPTPAELAPLFPDLEILELVGRGGMGVVYKARQKQLDRLVALKILAPKIAQDPAFAERFSREARAMAMLSHPHVVAVHDFGQATMGGESKGEGTGDAGVPLYYFLMEYVDGVNLRRLLDTGKLAPEEALAIVPQICDALQYAHDHGVVHRDIKPENVLLDKDGRVKIADFGIAKLVGRKVGQASPDSTQDSSQRPSQPDQQPSPESLTGAGQIVGTPQYMAPEQTEHPLEVDHRADIYSLGVVFYQMLTGELPTGRFAPPSSKVQIDVRLDEVVLRALEREPARRYQQVSEIKTQVETIAATSPEDGLPPPTQDAAIEPARLQVRGPAIGLLVTGMLNCLTIPMTVLFWGTEIQVGPRAEPSGVDITLGLAALSAVVFISLIPGVFTILAALKMKRLQAYGLAIAASILAIITSPISCLIGLPIGIWALVVLSQREVRAAFARNRQTGRVKQTDTRQSAAVPSDSMLHEPDEVTRWSWNAVPWQIWVVVVLLAIMGVGNFNILSTEPLAIRWLLAKCLFIVGLLRGWRWVFVVFQVEAAIHVVGFLNSVPLATLQNLLLMGLTCSAYRFYFPRSVKSSSRAQGVAWKSMAGNIILGVLFLALLTCSPARLWESIWRACGFGDRSQIAIAEALEEYRKTLVAYDLGRLSVSPLRSKTHSVAPREWTHYDAARLEMYPTTDSWPEVLGRVDTNPNEFEVVRRRSTSNSVITGPSAFMVPLDRSLVTEGYVTLLSLKGIRRTGTVMATVYTSLVCFGKMEGRLHFDSYATVLVKGDVSGEISGQSYFNLVVTGKFSGRISANSYAMIYLLGGCEGSVELRDRGKVYIVGRTVEEDLHRITGRGEVYLEDSDLPPGDHRIGDLMITVGKHGATQGNAGQAPPDIE